MAPVVLRSQDAAVLRTIFRRHPGVQKVLLFGSRAEGHAGRASDIDLAVSAPNMTLGEWARLVDDLEEAPIILEMDPVHLEQLPSGPFKDMILARGVRIYPEDS